MKNRKKVLIVEDELPLAMLMVSILTYAHCDVTVATCGQKAMEIAKEKRFDLITLDIELPDTTGFEICRQLKERHISYRTPVVFITGRPHLEDRRLALELGAVDYIEKPFEASDFIFRIATQIRNGQLNETASTQN